MNSRAVQASHQLELLCCMGTEPHPVLDLADDVSLGTVTVYKALGALQAAGVPILSLRCAKFLPEDAMRRMRGPLMRWIRLPAEDRLSNAEATMAEVVAGLAQLEGIEP